MLDAAGTSPAVLPPLAAGLTERELSVLRLLAAGRTKPQIAADLVISQSTERARVPVAACGFPGSLGKCLKVSTRAALFRGGVRVMIAAISSWRRAVTSPTICRSTGVSSKRRQAARPCRVRTSSSICSSGLPLVSGTRSQMNPVASTPTKA